jgi:hypothetical protein
MLSSGQLEAVDSVLRGLSKCLVDKSTKAIFMYTLIKSSVIDAMAVQLK